LSLAARGIQPSCFQRVVSLTMMRFLSLRMHDKRDVSRRVTIVLAFSSRWSDKKIGSQSSRIWTCDFLLG